MTARKRELALLGTAPLLTADLARVGPPDAVRRRAGIIHLHRGVVAHQDTDRSLAARVAVFLRGLPPGSIAYGVTALQLYGVRVGPAFPLHLATTGTSQTRRAELAISRLKRLPGLTERGWLKPTDALTSAAHQLDLLQLVTAGDWLVELGLADRAELVDALATMTGRGCRLARRAAPLLGARVRSPKETWLRLLLVLAGLPTPETNGRVLTSAGHVVHPDLVLRRWRVFAEYEGDQHRSDPRQWTYDIGRYEELAADDWIGIRVTASMCAQPRSIVRRVAGALRRHGYDGPPVTFTEEWCRLFERRL